MQVKGSSELTALYRVRGHNVFKPEMPLLKQPEGSMTSYLFSLNFNYSSVTRIWKIFLEPFYSSLLFLMLGQIKDYIVINCSDSIFLLDREQTQEERKTDQRTSKPLLAATLSGMLSVCIGSTMPSIGRMALLAIPETDNQSKLRLSLT